ncbi:MAG: SpoVG family protein [Methanocellales archaeon]
MPIEIDVRVHKVRSENKALRAYVNLTIGGEYAVHGIKVMENEKGLWVAMPRQKDALGTYRDIFHPITKEARNRLIETILRIYRADIDNEESRGYR